MASGSNLLGIRIEESNNETYDNDYTDDITLRYKFGDLQKNFIRKTQSLSNSKNKAKQMAHTNDITKIYGYFWDHSTFDFMNNKDNIAIKLNLSPNSTFLEIHKFYSKIYCNLENTIDLLYDQQYQNGQFTGVPKLFENVSTIQNIKITNFINEIQFYTYDRPNGILHLDPIVFIAFANQIKIKLNSFPYCPSENTDNNPSKKKSVNKNRGVINTPRLEFKVLDSTDLSKNQIEIPLNIFMLERIGFEKAELQLEKLGFVRV